jgi:hypothetical protein
MASNKFTHVCLPAHLQGLKDIDFYTIDEKESHKQLTIAPMVGNTLLIAIEFQTVVLLDEQIDELINILVKMRRGEMLQ